MRIKVLAAGLILSWATASFAQTAAAPPVFKFEMHGFVSGSLYLQDANMGPSEGQMSLFNNVQAPTTKATPVGAQYPQPQTDKLVLGGDVRQSRLNFSVTGPQVFGGATPKGVVEIDFFGGFGSGGYGDVSITPRLRLAYSELNWGAHRIQVGQNNDLLVAMIPVSLAHIAYPYSYGSGTLGWRRPAIWGYHTFGDIKSKDSTKVEVAWEVGRSQFADGGAIGSASCTAVAPCWGNGIGQHIVGATGDNYGFNLGEASGLPAVEARVTLLGGQKYMVWLAGHWNRIDKNGAGVASETFANGVSSDQDVLVGNVGTKIVVGPLTVAGTGYYGKNVGTLIGDFLQFTTGTTGDVHSYGAWGQAGFNFTKELSVWGFIGVEAPNRQEAIDAKFTKLQQVTSSALLQYRDGGYAVGFEWVHMHTTTNAANTPAGYDNVVDGNQYIISANYFF